MRLHRCAGKKAMAEEAAGTAAARVREALAARGRATLVAATGASQFEFLEALAAQPGIDWKQTTFFHLDEYVGLPATHPASFRKYLQERVAGRLHPGAFHYIGGDAPDPAAECRRLGGLIRRQPVDVLFCGIGENGHLAFNDPPADFRAGDPYRVVELDERCRLQQVGEGWFSGLEEVPRRAISMSIRQMMKAERVICVVPDRRKAQAVAECFDGPVSPLHPASILQQHPEADVYLDPDSASLLARG